MKCFACGTGRNEDKMFVAPAALRDLNNGREVKSPDLYRFAVCYSCRKRLIVEQGVAEDGFRSFKDTFKLLADREAVAARLIKESEASVPAAPTTDVVPDLAEPAASPDAQPAPETAEEQASGDNSIAQA
jgi:hypothetical protein